MSMSAFTYISNNLKTFVSRVLTFHGIQAPPCFKVSHSKHLLPSSVSVHTDSAG